MLQICAAATVALIWTFGSNVVKDGGTDVFPVTIRVAYSTASTPTPRRLTRQRCRLVAEKLCESAEHFKKEVKTRKVIEHIGKEKQFYHLYSAKEIFDEGSKTIF